MSLLILLLSIFEKNMLVVIREANMPIDCLKFGHWPKYYVFFTYTTILGVEDYRFLKKMATQFKTHFRVDPEKLFLMNNPIDVELIRNSASKYSQRRMNGRHFVAVGKLSRQKRFDRLVEMMPSMKQDDKLIIIGRRGGCSSTHHKRV